MNFTAARDGPRPDCLLVVRDDRPALARLVPPPVPPSARPPPGRCLLRAGEGLLSGRPGRGPPHPFWLTQELMDGGVVRSVDLADTGSAPDFNEFKCTHFQARTRPRTRPHRPTIPRRCRRLTHTHALPRRRLGPGPLRRRSRAAGRSRRAPNPWLCPLHPPQPRPPTSHPPPQIRPGNSRAGPRARPPPLLCDERGDAAAVPKEPPQPQARARVGERRQRRLWPRTLCQRKRGLIDN